MHANARTTPRSRADIVRLVLHEGQTVKDAAASFTVCPKTVRKWIKRYRTAGADGLKERSSRPASSPKRILPDRREAALAWRRQGLVYAEIAQRTGLSEATLSRLLHTVPRQPVPPPLPVVRYERATPGELLHLDIKKLGRIAPSATGLPEIRAITPGASAGNVSMCASMTTPGSPSLRSGRMSARKPRSPSSRRPSPAMPAWASVCSAS